MEFQYYYLLQDIPGVLIVFFSCRLLLGTLKSLSLKSMNVYKLLLCQLMALAAGVNLLMFKFSIVAWLGNMVLVFIAWIYGAKVLMQYRLNRQK